MTVVFVSGLIGAGKSEFCSYLHQAGAEVVSADELVSNLYDDNDWCNELELILGSEFRDRQGRFDKAKLAQTVFNQPDLLEKLEKFIHPQVQTQLRNLISQSKATVFVYEIPILRTSTDTSLADVIVLVEAPREVRLSRLIARGMSPADAEQRMLTQEQDSSRQSFADVIINNEATPQDLLLKANELYEKWDQQ